ncbi:B12 binding domain protein [Neomoorella glycerini]|uniref:B12 binding domain protein n=1 Tax=Neomoorella glycerini TaxID=55779 RepID=A0A6I5ZMN2_9FIRM|nr:B12-binding domain-containing protein [Moorella glycerini]QGP91142.1 B12 binding domain protein [Moorella glycerini]
MTNIAEALRDLNEDRVSALVDEKLQQGISPVDIIKECNEGIAAVGDLFASGQYYLTELMFSAEILQGVMAKLEPLLASIGGGEQSAGTVVIGTVKGTYP